MRALVLGTFVATRVFVLSGCAYLTNYTRSVDLDEHSYVMDVKQHIVFLRSDLRLARGRSPLTALYALSPVLMP